MYIYKTTNLTNHKVYIGKSEKIFDGTYYGSGILLWKAIKKYGIENFSVEVIESCQCVEELNEREIYWINFYKENSYNIANGGDGGWTTRFYTEEEMIAYKKKLSDSRRTWKISEETREKIRLKHKGRLMGDREKQRETLKKMWSDPSSIYNDPEYRKRHAESLKGHFVSEETKDKIRKTKLGGKNGMAVKIMVDDQIFETRRDCAKHYGISETAVTKRCKSKNFKNWTIIEK
jgi:group I intron endonuclease